ncbi:MAG: heme-binding protein [Eubacteriales bacterium]|nr:heme-binding protein [Eubacteriales bacterium]
MSVTYASLTELEQELTFSSFSRADALRLGLLIYEISSGYPEGPLATEITINGLVVYRYFQEGALPDSELWLERKRNAVDLMHMGSLRFGCLLEETGETLESRKLNPDDYAPGGGGMPIILDGTGVIGSVCVSGQPNHLDDQAIVVAALQRLKAEKEA